MSATSTSTRPQSNRQKAAAREKQNRATAAAVTEIVEGETNQDDPTDNTVVVDLDKLPKRIAAKVLSTVEVENPDAIRDSVPTKVGNGLHVVGKSVADFNLRKIGRGFKAIGKAMPKVEIHRGNTPETTEE